MKKLDARTLIELILLVVAIIFWGLRKANILYIPGLAAIALAIAMGLLGMGYIANKQKTRKLAGVLLLAYVLLIARLIYQSTRISDPFGSYLVMGVMAMLLFHVVENICMVIGLLPVTGIPLPFVSYGGSNMLTNMMAIGLAENVIMRSRMKESHRRVVGVRTRTL